MRRTLVESAILKKIRVCIWYNVNSEMYSEMSRDCYHLGIEESDIGEALARGTALFKRQENLGVATKHRNIIEYRHMSI
jgi:hypothetical protein